MLFSNCRKKKQNILEEEEEKEERPNNIETDQVTLVNNIFLEKNKIRQQSKNEDLQ